MGNLFNIDSPVMQGLSKFADLIWINILFVICSIPIITIGASTTAMYYVTLKMVRNEEGSITKDFFRSFKANFKQATIIWLITAGLVSVFIIDLLILIRSEFEYYYIAVGLIGIPGLLALFVALYAFPLLARFENKVFQTIKNALFISIAQIPRSIVMLIFSIIPIYLINYSWAWLPLLFICSFSVVAYANSAWMRKIFEKFEPEESVIESEDEGIFEYSEQLEKDLEEQD